MYCKNVNAIISLIKVICILIKVTYGIYSKSINSHWLVLSFQMERKVYRFSLQPDIYPIPLGPVSCRRVGKSIEKNVYVYFIMLN